ncbi:MAG: Hint domain-containing protein [Rhodospirillales bacterium]|nr:Hint domain-containing protein [Rhodospirillales bacterium]
MSQTFTYKFTDASGNTDSITVTASNTATTIPSNVQGATVTGDGYDVTAISGSIAGATISGETGSVGTVDTSSNGVAVYDNAIFPVANTGVNYSGYSGSQDGLSIAGLEFTVQTQSTGRHPHTITTEYNLYEQNGQFELLTVTGNNSGTSSPLTLVSTTAPCFCAGTRIATPGGLRLVEELEAGDTVLTATGEAKAVRWMGRRVVDMQFADLARNLPVRIKAGALGNGLPTQDLMVSPDHAMFLDGILVQAGAMVNGTSIVREGNMPTRFTYYHIETAEHDLILAEGAPTETFVDNIDRMAFDNWAEYAALVDGTEAILEMDYPRAKSARQVPASLRAKLDACAAPYARLQAA